MARLRRHDWAARSANYNGAIDVIAILHAGFIAAENRSREALGHGEHLKFRMAFQSGDHGTIQFRAPRFAPVRLKIVLHLMRPPAGG